MPKMRDQFGLILILELRPCLATKMHSFYLSFILLHFGPSTLFYLLHKLCYFYNSLTSFYLMTFVSCFDTNLPLLISEFLRFQVLHLIYEKFKLYLHNTLNMLKTTMVYFRVLQPSCTCGCRRLGVTDSCVVSI